MPAGGVAAARPWPDAWRPAPAFHPSAPLPSPPPPPHQVYDLPITKAATELNTGVTVLKKYCRKFNIQRWPYRKRKSMRKLIETVERHAVDTGTAAAVVPVLAELR
jgi:hypothetical protein